MDSTKLLFNTHTDTEKKTHWVDIINTHTHNANTRSNNFEFLVLEKNSKKMCESG